MRIHTQDVQQVVLRAVTELEKFVSPTYGPAGRGVLVDSSVTDPNVLDDGFAVVEKFELENEYENAVIRFVKETSRKTNRKAGDGTTTSILTMCKMVILSIGEISKLVIRPDLTKIADELRTALAEAVEQIRAAAKPIKTQEELKAIALNSYRNEDIAGKIAEVVHAVGIDGVVTLENSDTHETETEVVRGFSFDRGCVSPYLSDNKTITLKNPVIIATDEEIVSFEQVQGVMNQALEKGKSDFLIIAHDITGEALSTLIINNAKKVINVAAVKAPGFANDRLELLEDLAVFTGGQAFIARSGHLLSEATYEACGTAKKVVVTDTDTVIIDGAGKQSIIDERVELLRPYTKKGAEFDRERYKRRIASLSQGVGIIRVGGHTEAERANVKAKVDDAVNATQLAFRDGVIPGGGKMLDSIKTSSELFNQALKYPGEILRKNGKDALSDNVTDPAGVLIAALESAVSIAAILITISGISTDKAEKPKSEVCA